MIVPLPLFFSFAAQLKRKISLSFPSSFLLHGQQRFSLRFSPPPTLPPERIYMREEEFLYSSLWRGPLHFPPSSPSPKEVCNFLPFASFRILFSSSKNVSLLSLLLHVASGFSPFSCERWLSSPFFPPGLRRYSLFFSFSVLLTAKRVRDAPLFCDLYFSFKKDFPLSSSDEP